MSKKIPFLDMFSALMQWPELAQAVERWCVNRAVICREDPSAKVLVEGASGAGPNLILQVEEHIRVLKADGAYLTTITTTEEQFQKTA